jgi:hypothetical protein
MQNRNAIAGRAIVTAERSNGVINPARTAIKRAMLLVPGSAIDFLLSDSGGFLAD